MQVTTYMGAEIKEYFTGASEGELKEKMDTRLSELEAVGHALVKREKIGRNAACPCGSGAKFKKCCIDKAA